MKRLLTQTNILVFHFLKNVSWRVVGGKRVNESLLLTKQWNIFMSAEEIHKLMFQTECTRKLWFIGKLEIRSVQCMGLCESSHFYKIVTKYLGWISRYLGSWCGSF